MSYSLATHTKGVQIWKKYKILFAADIFAQDLLVFALHELVLISVLTSVPKCNIQTFSHNCIIIVIVDSTRVPLDSGNILKSKAVG